MIAHRGQTIGQNVLNSGIESSCFARILKMEEQLIFGGPIYFFARLFFGRLQMAFTVPRTTDDINEHGALLKGWGLIDGS
jgi:hypothetical protein